MLMDFTDIINNIPMGNGNIRIAVQTYKDRAGSEGVARVSGVPYGSGSVNSSTALKGGGRCSSNGLGVGLEVRIPVLRGVGITGRVRGGASSAPRLNVGFGFPVGR